MTDREKLIDLLNDSFDKQYSQRGLLTAPHTADYLIANGVTVQRWIPVSERLPEEHDSIFTKFYGTERWTAGMFLTTSNDVLVCLEYEAGTRAVKTLRTNAGEWNLGSIWKAKVTHWMPLPEPPKEKSNGA